MLVAVALGSIGTTGCIVGPPRPEPTRRTCYSGFVEIEPVLLSELRTRLETQGCRDIGFQGETASACRYKEAQAPQSNESCIEIFPEGAFGMGPIAFWVSEGRIWVYKDLFGPPNPEDFKEAVRKDVETIGRIVRIKEDSWTIIESHDCTDVVY
jgi:hypothetical protein